LIADRTWFRNTWFSKNTWFRSKSASCFIIVVVTLLGLRGAAVARTPLNLRENALPPIAHAVFCMNYPRECSESAAAASFFSARAEALYAVLVVVNRYINTTIRPIRVAYRNILDDRWLLSPLSGNCNDYAVSKRHELLRLGWPSGALLLAEVVLATGEHHLVLVAKAGGDSFVLDNLRSGVVPLTAVAGYRWIRIESPDDPKFWLAFDSR
jgi:predicted transglutaminase-like cysteine proteinase